MGSGKCARAEGVWSVGSGQSAGANPLKKPKYCKHPRAVWPVGSGRGAGADPTEEAQTLQISKGCVAGVLQ